MNWVNELMDLYEKNRESAGKMITRPKQNPLVLLPVFHTTVAAQVTITLDLAGNFLQAEAVPEEDKITLIPVTEKSGSRTANLAPHPLCDTIRYLAGDYMEFYSGKKEKNFRPYFEAYIGNLRKWKECPYTHEKVNAIYAYVNKETLVKDLVHVGILKLDESGRLTEEEKIQKIAQTEIMIRFRVLSGDDISGDILMDESGKHYAECWLDRTLQESFINFTRSAWEEKRMSYLTGEMTKISFLHPKKIRNEGDGTKLISANDSSNFTYRGRFSTEEEAFAIGYEESQKVHNALKWIIRKQGFFSGDLCIVVWDSDMMPIPKWYEDADAFCDEYEEEEDDEQGEVTYAGTNVLAAKRFQKALKGYGKKLDGMSKTVLLSMDAATPGRLSMTESKTFQTTRYIENIGYWHNSGEWIHRKFKDKQLVTYFGMPGIYDIAKILYGSDSDDILTLKGKEKLYTEICKKLLPCITDRKKVPANLVRLAKERASSPQSFHNSYNWEAAVSLACSFIKKQRKEEKKEEWTLEIKEPCMERDYLYGRLLAVADWIEYISMDKDEKRETNARRYMKAFSKRPFSTWQVIEEKMQPYLNKLNPGAKYKYNVLLDELHRGFTAKDYSDNSELNGLYLLGYHQQSYAFKKKKEEENHE